MYWYGWYKFAHNTFYCISRYAPYSKKAQYMINSESIEIFTHLLKTLSPPTKSILLHFFPVVGRKTPVLAFNGKIIRRCTCLCIHIIQFGCHPGIAAIAVNTNRQIAFYYYAVFMCISCSRL